MAQNATIVEWDLRVIAWRRSFTDRIDSVVTMVINYEAACQKPGSQAKRLPLKSDSARDTTYSGNGRPAIRGEGGVSVRSVQRGPANTRDGQTTLVDRREQ